MQTETLHGLSTEGLRIHSWVLGAFLFILPATILRAEPARIEKIQGIVELRAPSMLDWEKITPGQKVPEGSTLRTRANSSADVLTGRGHRYVLKADTILQISSLQADETKARLEKGRVLSKVKHLQAKEKFSMETPTAVCAVRGTEFETTTGEKGTLVAVFQGVVGVAALGSDKEISLGAGQMTSVHDGTIEVPRSIPQETQRAGDAGLAKVARHEVGLDMDRNEVIAAAVMEQRLAEYKEGKSLIDVEGHRVRIEEYILRPRADQYKFVVLNERDDRLDYFYYLGTFNQTLPTDLSLALRDVSGKVGTTAPDYYLTAYEMGQSNTQDSIQDTASGGHLVKVTVDGNGDYVLTDPSNPSNTRTVEASELQLDGTYKIYNPIADKFSSATASEVEEASKVGLYLPETDTFRNLASGDTVWKTRFNSYTHALNGTTKISYSKSGANDVLAANLDASWYYAGGFVLPVVQTTPGKLDVTITNYYGDGTFERYRTLLIDDQGTVAPESAFAGVSTGAAYKDELVKWNYQQQVTASEFGGRKIDLVVEPKIFIKSGLIQ